MQDSARELRRAVASAPRRCRDAAPRFCQALACGVVGLGVWGVGPCRIQGLEFGV